LVTLHRIVKFFDAAYIQQLCQGYRILNRKIGPLPMMWKHAVRGPGGSKQQSSNDRRQARASARLSTATTTAPPTISDATLPLAARRIRRVSVGPSPTASTIDHRERLWDRG
jgi:hypothetical protein